MACHTGVCSEIVKKINDSGIAKIMKIRALVSVGAVGAAAPTDFQKTDFAPTDF